MSVAKKIVKVDGIAGLYAGVNAALLRQATYGTARIGLHSNFSEKLRDYNGGANIPICKLSCSGVAAPPTAGHRITSHQFAGQKFISSFCSGAIASSIGNPFDVALVRMQADTSKPVAEQFGIWNQIATTCGFCNQKLILVH